jgi:hypothetical protein
VPRRSFRRLRRQSRTGTIKTSTAHSALNGSHSRRQISNSSSKYNNNNNNRDRFYETPFRPKTFRIKISSSNFGQLSTQKNIDIILSEYYIWTIILYKVGILKPFKVMIGHINLTKNVLSLLYQNFGRNGFLKWTPTTATTTTATAAAAKIDDSASLKAFSGAASGLDVLERPLRHL